jgi:protocatechuate 3,4-dioxygenase beta subunit
MTRSTPRHRASGAPDPRRLTRRDGLAAAAGGLGMAAIGIGAMASKLVVPQRLVYGFPDVPGDPVGGPLSPLVAQRPQEATRQWDEGPFYAPNTPLKADLRLPGHAGTDLVVRGRVVDTTGAPIAGAVLDFWQVDEHAAYDNVGYDYRGHQYTRRDGSYELQTVVPVPYTFARLWRFPHIHVKVQGPTTRLLTTQLFFDNDPHGYARHVRIDRALMTDLHSDGNGGVRTRFDFVLRRTS